MLAGRASVGAVDGSEVTAGTDGRLQALRTGDGLVRAQSTKAKLTAVTRKRLQWALLAERGSGCEACHLTPVGGRPQRPWEDMHERLTRARGGDPTDPGNILCVCRRCHDWIGTHETDARALGLVRGRTAEEHQAATKPWLSTT